MNFLCIDSKSAYDHSSISQDQLSYLAGDNSDFEGLRAAVKQRKEEEKEKEKLLKDEEDERKRLDNLANEQLFLKIDQIDPRSGKYFGEPYPKGAGNLARYQIGRAIGEGGDGTIYEVLDRKINRIIVAKFQNNPNDLLKFADEVKKMAHLENARVLPIYDVIDTEFGKAILMPQEKAPTLRKKIEQEGSLPPQKIKEITQQLILSLQFFLKKERIHGDIKPSNIFIGDDYVRVADFGSSRKLNDRNNDSFGTPRYLPPEYLRGEIPLMQKDAEAEVVRNVFTLGVMIYEMMTGKSPYPPMEDGNANKLYAAMIQEFEIEKHPKVIRYIEQNHLVESYVEEFLKKCLAPKKENRYQNFQEFTIGLRKAFDNDVLAMQYLGRSQRSAF